MFTGLVKEQTVGSFWTWKYNEQNLESYDNYSDIFVGQESRDKNRTDDLKQWIFVLSSMFSLDTGE